MSAFFISASCQSRPPELNNNCPPSGPTENARVEWVYDADTLKLDDGRRLRIIGVDAPEMPNRKRKQAGEPYAGQATEALRELLARHDYRILLQPGQQQHDKYQRLLAHVYTPDQLNISAWLLEQGYANTLLLHPNFRYDECYIRAEKYARHQARTIWSLPSHQLRMAETLDPAFSGFIRLAGTVRRIKRHKNRWVVALDGQIYITIKEPEAALFGDIDSLKNQMIIATGVLYRRHGKAYLRIRHPAHLEISPSR